MTTQELQQLAQQWPKGKPLMLPGIIEDAYQAGALKMLELVQLHMASVVTKDFNKTASVFQLDGLIASNRDHFLKSFQELLP